MVMSEEWKDLVANGVEGIVDSRMVTRRRGEKHQRRNPEKGGMGEINIYKKGKSHGVTLALFLHSEGSPRREKKKILSYLINRYFLIGQFALTDTAVEEALAPSVLSITIVKLYI